MVYVVREKTHKIRGRMIPWILMLFILTPCVCAGTLVVNVKQPSYQAKTVNWRDSKILYHLHKGIEVQTSQDQQFSGRVQCDEDVLRDGRLRLHVSRIRSEDSGQYVCEVNRDHDGNYGKCQLVVIKPADLPKAQRPTVTSQPEGKMGLYFPLTQIHFGSAGVLHQDVGEGGAPVPLMTQLPLDHTIYSKYGIRGVADHTLKGIVRVEGGQLRP
ncbi:unnamed protein product [Pleuronectes platessa]|uniref:Ig-like domain-containing protein n=1 Tax=Pleuronectes platessa TaxID=8262 RepID=A0A9N7UYH6_PLEPL|nr:unnamed protein product [Pleuronectes platessa]